MVAFFAEDIGVLLRGAQFRRLGYSSVYAHDRAKVLHDSGQYDLQLSLQKFSKLMNMPRGDVGTYSSPKRLYSFG